MAGTVTDLGSTLLVEGDWGTDDFLRRGGTETLIDCTTATWGFNTASGDDYPCRLKDWQNAFTFKGGTVNGTISLTASWGSKYSVGQGAAVFAQNPAGPPTITGWRMDRVWDAIRVTFRDGYIIENCHVSRARDDAVECDTGMSGTIRNCLFEDVMPSISLGDVNTPDSTHKTVEIDNVLIKQAMYEYNGMKHFTPF